MRVDIISVAEFRRRNDEMKIEFQLVKDLLQLLTQQLEQKADNISIELTKRPLANGGVTPALNIGIAVELFFDEVNVENNDHKMKCQQS